MKIIKNLENLLAQGQDSALLRFSIGSAYLKQAEFSKAIEHLSRAVDMDNNQSAAWKLLGKSLAANEQFAEARKAFEKGIAVAEKKGDIQAKREMQVFLKRLDKDEQESQKH